MIDLNKEDAQAALYALQVAPCDESPDYDEGDLTEVADRLAAKLELVADHDDPRAAGGSAFDAGGPHDRGRVMYDARKAVLVEQFTVSVAEVKHRGEPQPDVVGLEVRGRINRPPNDEIAASAPAEPVNILTLASWDLAAELVAELHALAIRDASSARFTTMVQAAWADLEAKGLTTNG